MDVKSLLRVIFTVLNEMLNRDLTHTYSTIEKEVVLR